MSLAGGIGTVPETPFPPFFSVAISDACLGNTLVLLGDIVNAFHRDSGDESAAVEEKPLSVNRLEWEHVNRVLRENNGNVSATARALGIYRRTPQRKLNKHPLSD